MLERIKMFACLAHRYSSTLCTCLALQDKMAISAVVFWPPNVEQKHLSEILDIYDFRYFVICQTMLQWFIIVTLFDFLCVCLSVQGSLAVFFVGLPGEAAAAWSPLLHQAAGQEMCSAPQHTGRIHFVPLASILCHSSMAIVCCSHSSVCSLYSSILFSFLFLSACTLLSIFGAKTLTSHSNIVTVHANCPCI